MGGIHGRPTRCDPHLPKVGLRTPGNRAPELRRFTARSSTATPNDVIYQPMAEERTGGDLFIVDNSISGWTGLRYLREWCGIAKSFDIATGFFEIGALLALDQQWQQLEKIRILMGDEVTRPTRAALLNAVRERAGHVPASGVTTTTISTSVHLFS